MNEPGYSTCKNCKDKIDEVLRINAALYTNLGIDCSKTAYKEAGLQERKNLRSVRRYDHEKIDLLLRRN